MSTLRNGADVMGHVTFQHTCKAIVIMPALLRMMRMMIIPGRCGTVVCPGGNNLVPEKCVIVQLLSECDQICKVYVRRPVSL